MQESKGAAVLAATSKDAAVPGELELPSRASPVRLSLLRRLVAA
jgi:hypothetical protein